jgi:hypothetical protein
MKTCREGEADISLKDMATVETISKYFLVVSWFICLFVRFFTKEPQLFNMSQGVMSNRQKAISIIRNVFLHFSSKTGYLSKQNSFPALS